MTVNGKLPTLPPGAEPLHADPRWVVTIAHDGQVQITGCAWCRDAEVFATALVEVAAQIRAQS